MPRGPDPTTRRSPTQGGRELRARVSGEEYARVQAAAEAERMTVPAYVRGVVLGRRELDDVPAVVAEAVEGPAAPCLTCRYATTRADRNACRMVFDSGVWHYRVYSGALVSDDGLPTDRDMRCPGWAAKETT